jgi:hypothetical protein
MIRTILIVATLSFSAFPAAPSTPALLSPLCKQTGVAPTPRFSWRKAIGASSYQLQISSDFGYKTLVKDTGGLRDTTYNQTQFLYFSTYYWRVKAQGAGGMSQWSNSRIFKTEMVRYIFNWSLAAHDDSASGNITDKLTYFRALGYNYVLSYLDYTRIMPFMAYNASGQDSGHWVFNKHAYTDQSKNVIRDFIALKSAVESCGLHILPAIGDCSHQEQWINGTINDNGDSLWRRNDALSEFSSPARYEQFVKSNELLPGNNRNGVYCADDSNKTASDIFIEQLNIIQSNWGHSALGGLYPQYIHIGHDEIGNWSARTGRFVCYVGAEKTKDLVALHGGGSVGQAWVIAHQIKTKYGQVSACCNPGVKVIVWGDCFIPLNNGQSAGLTGDRNGNGGILQFLRDTMRLTYNCIIEPWNYSYVNGTPLFDAMVFNQGVQISYIQKLGFGYVLASGEGDAYFDSNGKIIVGGMANVRQHLQVAFEQAAASREYPNNLYGYGNMLYQATMETGGFNDTLVGYTAPILAYFGWFFQPTQFLAFSPKVYKKFDPIKSRKNLRWSLGIDYFAP